MREELPLASKAFLCGAKCICVPLLLLFALLSSGQGPDQDGARHPGGGEPPVHRQTALWWVHPCALPLLLCSPSPLEGSHWVLATWENTGV